MTKKLAELLCSVLLFATISYQAPFWIDIIVYRLTTDINIKCMAYSSGFLVLTGIVLVVHNFARFILYLVASRTKRLHAIMTNEATHAGDI